MQGTPFIGRERELRGIQIRLADPKYRLLTLFGPGGIGKTRLALEAAEQFTQQHGSAFPDGFHFVSLQPLTASDLIASRIAETLHFQFFSGGEPKEQLLDYLRDKSCLLILDNFEHLLDDAAFVSDLLAVAPAIKVLVTSRETLNLQEEWVYTVRGMPYPRTSENLENYEAVQLFIHHAQRLRSDFSLTDEAEGVLRICALAEGMPLALELAAAWVRVLSCSEIADEIKAGLDILETPTRNVLPRHRNMRAVLEHSWVLLSDVQREAFKKLSVFRGGFTREAALDAADASLRTLSALVDKSWLRWDPIYKRYDFHELLRQYGQEHLQADKQVWQEAHERHCQYYAHFLGQRWDDLRSAREKEAYELIEIEQENVRACWEWAVGHQEEAAISEALDSLWLFYDMGSGYQEGLNVFAQAATMLRSRASNPASRLLLGKVLAYQGALVSALDRFKEAGALLRESRSILSDYAPSSNLAFCIYRLSMTLSDVSNPEWHELILESLAIYRQIGDLSGIGEALSGLGAVYQFQFGDLQRAVEATQESLTACLQVGDQRGSASTNARLARLALEQSDYLEARRYAEKSLATFEQLGIVWGLIIAYREYGWAACGLGEYGDAQRAAYHSLSIAAKYHLMRFATDTLVLVANILRAIGEPERSVELFTLVDETSMGMKFKYSAVAETLSKLASELDSERYCAAVKRGRALDLQVTVKAILQEWEQKINLE